MDFRLHNTEAVLHQPHLHECLPYFPDYNAPQAIAIIVYHAQKGSTHHLHTYELYHHQLLKP